MTRTRTVRRALLAGLATLSLGLAACGDDDAEGGDDTTATDDTASDDTTATEDTATEDTSTEDTATDDTATGDTGGETDGGDVDLDEYVAVAQEQLAFTDDATAECVARGIIEPIGADEIGATGLSPDDFVGADSIADTGIEIDDDLRAEMEGQIAECGGLVDELVASEFSGDADAAACVTDILTEEVVANVLVAGLTGGEPSQAARDAQEQTEECAPES